MERISTAREVKPRPDRGHLLRMSFECFQIWVSSKAKSCLLREQAGELADQSPSGLDAKEPR